MFCEGLNDPPEDEPWFIEEYEDLLITYEERLVKEGMTGANELIENLRELDCEWDFELDMTEFYTNEYHRLYTVKNTYVSDIDEYETEYSPEYRKIEKAVNDKQAEEFKRSGNDHRMRRQAEPLVKEFRVELTKNVIEKNWDKFKSIYKKWLDYVHERRGHLKLKKYDL